MLAEPKRKVRYTVNPSGAGWADSESKFGQRMLERMGWRSGEGLGKGGRGIAEPLKVKQKSDNRGVGCSTAHAEKSLPQTQDFASLLQQLNSEHVDAASSSAAGAAPAGGVMSLEAKSRGSRARLHYHKFARGKDVSAYASADLACIFGDRAKRRQGDDGEAPETATAKLAQSASDSCLAAEGAGDSGLTLVRSGSSLQEYFREKMRQRQQQQQQQQQQQEEDAGWTSESSCSQPSSCPDSPDRKRVRFAVSPPPRRQSPSPQPPPPPPEAEAADESESVIDFSLFTGSCFVSVLGYPYY